MFKNLLDKGKCALGFHDGAWTFVAPGQCSQRRICTRCGSQSHRISHQWGEWTYLAEDGCDLTRTCIRCAETERRTAHEWGQWDYIDAQGCTQARQCARCGQFDQEGETRMHHAWGDWSYSEPYRTSIHTCDRCGHRESGFSHQAIAPAETVPEVGHSPDLNSLVARRQAIMEAFWQVEDSVAPEAPEVTAAAAEAARQLDRLLARWPAEGDSADPLEIGRTWRYLGDAYFSQSGKENQALLDAAHQAYQNAESHLTAAGDQLEWAKWAFNQANVLRLIRKNDLFPHLAQAKTLYAAARPIFEAEMPAGLDRVDASLESLATMMQAHQLLVAAKADKDQATTLAERLKQAGDDQEQLKSIEQEIERLEAGEPDLIAQAEALTGSNPIERGQPPSITDQGREALLSAVDAGADMSQLFGLLQKQYQAEIEAGRISPERRQMLDAVMTESGRLVNGKADALPDMVARSAKAKSLLNRMTDAVASPDAQPQLSDLPAGSRAADLAEWSRRLMKFVVSAFSGPYHSDRESETLIDLQTRYIHNRNAIAALDTGADAGAAKLERENLRQLAMETRAFSLRNHLTLAHPAWPCPAVHRDPNLLFYSGGPAVMAQIERCLAGSHLTLSPRETQGNPAQFRWNHLRQCNAAIFDLTAYRPGQPVEKAAPVAAVGYELGMALALGRPVVVVAQADQQLPFDVDVTAVRIAHDDRNEARLRSGVDQVLYGLQRGGGDSSVDETLDYVRGAFGANLPDYARITLKQIDAKTRPDPFLVADILAAALGYSGPESPHIIYPTWPGDYPALHPTRCFHVTAFGPEWAARTMALIREACRRTNPQIDYIRGDQVLSPDIIRSIWDEICRASHIVVDLTGLNLNAVMELGMAQTLGRNILLITQDAHPEHYFAAIAKIRIHHYSLEDTDRLNRVVDTFLGQG